VTYLKAAILHGNATFKDPLGRREGEPLDPLRHTAKQLAQIEAVQGPQEWASMWQQTPRLPGGGMFDRSFFTSDDRRRVLTPRDFDRRTEGLDWARFYDCAFTEKAVAKQDPDYTVGTRMAFKFDEYYTQFEIFVYGQVRWRTDWSKVKKNIREVAKEDGEMVRIGCEKNGPQMAAYLDLVADPELANYAIFGLNVLRDKVAKAQPWMDRAREGFMYLRDGSWLNPFYDECESFPNGSKDDIVDSVSGGYFMCIEILAGGDGEVEERKEQLGRRW
jgi:phage terminase large subunit-like protein